MAKKELIGCIADDFTGAADVCSFLVKAGAKCVLMNDVASEIPDLDVDVVVIALKIRTIDKEEALKKVRSAVKFLEDLGATRIFDKYCSTFDSTSEGNIGPILDYLIDRYDQKYSILSPALPENEREVFNGYLFADKILLNEGSMVNHPLTPMKDANLVRLMNSQSKYKSYSLRYNLIEEGKESIDKFVESIDKSEKFYIVTDYFKEIHGKNIIESFGNLKVLSGSSVFITDWYEYLFRNENKKERKKYKQDKSKSVLFSGSLSNQTTKQIKSFIEKGGLAIEVKADDINEQYIRDSKKRLLEEKRNILFYSSRDEGLDEKKLKINAEKLESYFSNMSLYAYEHGINKIIVAGGETSGAVIKSLPFTSYQATNTVAPGVPVLRPTENKDFQIVLKSGNFGQEDFFNRSISIMEN